jgi:hypothetical protein
MRPWSYFRITAATIEDARTNLWNPDLGPDAYGADGERYQAAILEQYKLYVEMADRISARRALANAFFLSLNTGLLAAAGAVWQASDFSVWTLVVALPVLLVQAGTWYWLIASYRQLNSAKYAVVGALEERLPASPYWRSEWTALGKGADPTKYRPLTHLEQWLPIIFAVFYLVGFVLALSSEH